MYTWLFSENLSNTMNNNSWYYFEHIALKQPSDISVYFILSKTKDNVSKVNVLKPKLRQKIVWRNSIKHHRLYWKADMYYVTLSYRDILPDKYRKQYNLQPLIYLQHGTVAMKKIGYKGDSYSNSIYKFITYGPKEKDVLIENNFFSDHQLHYSTAHPRYKELVRLNDQYKNSSTQQGQILWFLTWREYINDSFVSENEFLKKIKEVLKDENLQNYLRNNSKTLKVVVHQLFNLNDLKISIKDIDDELISLHYASDIDVMQDIAMSETLITDYSSIGFDFTFLKKPVVLYHFDSLIYSTKREFYCDLETDFDEYRVTNKDQLINMITKKEKKLNTFFVDRLPKNIDYDYVKQGGHIDEMNSQFMEAQRNKVSFIGYNFFGRGGTVTATKSLAEGFAENGYIVELVSLKRIRSNNTFPNGMIVKSFLNPWRSQTESIKYHLFKQKSLLSYLEWDVNKNLLIPYVGFALKKYLENTKSRTIVSTRESLHLFLDDTTNKYIKNKLYFFHTSPDVVNDIYPNVMSAIKNREIKKALFVSESSRIGYKNIIGYDNYESHAITGNSLLSTEVVTPEDIQRVKVKDKYSGIVLTRISKDRKHDLDNLIEFAKYVKENAINNVSLDVYGMGDALYDFCDSITRYDLTSIINYKGLTTKPYEDIREHDFLVDFSNNHSFGMIYLEAILNGVSCFAKENMGSKEVLSNIPNSIFTDWSDLIIKINDLPNVTKKQLVTNYNILNTKYSRDSVVDKVKNLID